MDPNKLLSIMNTNAINQWFCEIEDTTFKLLPNWIIVRVPAKVNLLSESMTITIKPNLALTGKAYQDGVTSTIAFDQVKLIKIELSRKMIWLYCSEVNRAIKFLFSKEAFSTFADCLLQLKTLLTVADIEKQVYIGGEILWMGQVFTEMGQDWPIYLLSKPYIHKASKLQQKNCKSALQVKHNLIRYQIVPELKAKYHYLLSIMRMHLVAHKIDFFAGVPSDVLIQFEKLLKQLNCRINPICFELEKRPNLFGRTLEKMFFDRSR